jgi:type II secretory pathway pseudopilin PulG
VIIDNSQQKNSEASTRKAFTFIEAMIAVGIFSIIIVATQQFFVTGERTWQRDVELVHLQHEARRILDDTVKELRASTDITVTAVDSSSNKINFDPPGETNISYYLLATSYGGSQTIRQLIRDATPGETCDTSWSDSSCRVVGSYVEELFFCCWHDDGGGGEVCDATCAGSTRLEIKIRTEKIARAKSLSYPPEDSVNSRYLKAVMRLRNE